MVDFPEGLLVDVLEARDFHDPEEGEELPVFSSGGPSPSESGVRRGESPYRPGRSPGTPATPADDPGCRLSRPGRKGGRGPPGIPGGAVGNPVQNPGLYFPGAGGIGPFPVKPFRGSSSLSQYS